MGLAMGRRDLSWLIWVWAVGVKWFEAVDWTVGDEWVLKWLLECCWLLAPMERLGPKEFQPMDLCLFSIFRDWSMACSSVRGPLTHNSV